MGMISQGAPLAFIAHQAKDTIERVLIELGPEADVSAPARQQDGVYGPPRAPGESRVRLRRPLLRDGWAEDKADGVKAIAGAPRNCSHHLPASYHT